MWYTRRHGVRTGGVRQYARESIKALTALPCSCQQLQCRLNESGTRGTQASMQSDRHGALTCMGRVGACAASSLGVCGVVHQPTNEKRDTHMHTVASWSNGSWSTQHGRCPGQRRCMRTWWTCMGDMQGVRTCGWRAGAPSQHGNRTNNRSAHSE